MAKHTKTIRRVTDVLYGADGHVLKFDIYQGTVALNCCKSHKHS